MKISHEINLMILGGMLILGLLSAGISLYSIGQTSHKEMADIRELLMSERRTQLVDLVANAYSVLETADYYEPTQRAISEMRFGDGGKNHFFVFDTDGMFWVHPARPDIVGTVQIGMTDAAGKEWVRDVIEKARDSEHGFIEYQDRSPDRTTPETRLVHYRLYPKWSWIVAAGISIDDIEEILARKDREIGAAMRAELFQIAGMLAVVLLVTMLISSILVSRRIVKPIVTITEAAERIGAGDFSSTIDVHASQEINKLAHSIKQMQNSLAIALERIKRRAA